MTVEMVKGAVSVNGGSMDAHKHGQLTTYPAKRGGLNDL